MIRLIANIIIFASVVTFYSCTEPITGTIENQSPQTYLSLFPDSVIAPGSTLKKISWWGDDPDGFVAGFRISFDSINWGYTTKNDSTFLLSINGNDSTFRFYVAAVDDKGAVDPSPASNLYPVINTPPSMVFQADTEIPDTTFPIATFKWTGTDPDGNSTIRYYYWALNDTNNFRQISGSLDIMTLTADSGLVLNSNNILYMKAQDNAGAFSNIVRMPDTSRTWFVKSVTAKVLLIKDMPISQMSTADSYFSNALDTISYDVLDIKSNNGSLIPTIVNPMFIETLKLFEIVVWSANRGNVSSDDANFDLAQQSLPFYTLAGGKLFFTTGLPNVESQAQGNLINFAPIDSITYCTIALITSNLNLIASDPSYPVLTSSNLIQRTRGMKIPSTTQIVYRLPINTSCQDSTIVAIKDKQMNPSVIFMSMPVYYLNGNPTNSKTFFRKVLIEEFGLR